MKKIVALLLMSVMMLALTGCGGSDKKDEKAAGSDKKVVLKLSHVFSPDEQLYKSMELVAERIKKKTNGRVEIQCFGQNQLHFSALSAHRNQHACQQQQHCSRTYNSFGKLCFL